MYHTVQLSSCVSAQGELVEILGNGEIVVRDGGTTYRGRPVSTLARTRVAPASDGSSGLEGAIRR